MTHRGDHAHRLTNGVAFVEASKVRSDPDALRDLNLRAGSLVLALVLGGLVPLALGLLPAS